MVTSTPEAKVIHLDERRNTMAQRDAMRTKSGRTLSPQAAAAKLIRKELKAAWPTIRFSVKSSSFAGGDAVDIEWTDGPTVHEVEAISKKYQCGHFDGMFDLYEYTNTRHDIPQAKYVQCQRSTSNDAKREAVAWLNQVRGWDLRLIEHPEVTRGKYTNLAWVEVDPASDFHTGSSWASHEIHRVSYAQSLICRECQHTAHVGDRFCGECGQPVAHDETYHLV